MKTYIKDILWNMWFSLPSCRKRQKEYENSARSRFDKQKNGDFTIVSTNCIAGEIYHILGMPFTSPFINVSLDRNDFVTLALNFKGYMQNPLEIVAKNDNGEWIGKLSCENQKDIKMCFPHETDKDVIIDNFERRKKRINYDNLYFITDDDGLTKESFEQFAKVECTNKIIFTSKEYKEYPYSHYLSKYSGMPHVGKYQSKTKSGLYEFQTIWDFVEWFNSSK